MDEIIVLGGGGQCRSSLEVIEAMGRFKVAGIVDKKEKLNERVLDYRVTASDEDLPELVKRFKYFFIALGHLRNPAMRIERFEYLKSLGAEFPVIVSPLAHISSYACIGEGTIVMHRAVVGPNAEIGKNCILNTGAIIEHDVKIGSHCHISTGSIVNGECEIGQRSFIASNSVIANCVKIADDTIIGAGSVVVKDIFESGVYVGIPAKRLLQNV